MAGVGEPALLVRGAGSPHAYSLKPSEARLLEEAQVIFWVGGSLETFMEKPLSALGAKARVVEVMRAPGIALLPGRVGGAWEGHAGPEGDGRDHGAAGRATGHGLEAMDGHLWLDPDNAQAVARLAASVLGEADPANRGRYRDNARNTPA
jgi:zinc transport system substrate-binding protein